MASVTVRADGAAVFQLRYVPAATRTPCSLSTGQIDSTLKPRARIWSMNPQISGGGSSSRAKKFEGVFRISLASLCFGLHAQDP
jgi:hypothetical protein